MRQAAHGKNAMRSETILANDYDWNIIVENYLTVNKFFYDQHDRDKPGSGEIWYDNNE